MSKILPIQIPPASDMDQLRLSITNAINKLIAQINASVIDTNLDVRGNRIVSVASPASLTDAANKDYVDKQVKANR